MGAYSPPDLPYDYAGLEPAISGEILELHHAKHHAANVNGANDTLEQLAESREKSQFGTLAALEKTLAFNCPGMSCSRSSGRTCPRWWRAAR